MHALVKLANLAGFPTNDVMDTYIINDLTDNPMSNFMTQWGLLAPFLTQNNMPTYKYFSPTTDPLMIGVSPVLMHIADTARGIAGVPFEITSGLRSPSQNTAVGGTSNSSHLSGLALDLACSDDATRTKMLTGLLTCGSPLFLEIAPTHLHIDIDALIHPLGLSMVSTSPD